MSDYWSSEWRQHQTLAHKIAAEKGFWDHDRSDGELIALIHSELSEALEAAREGNPPDDKLPYYGGREVELADAVIRIMDYAEVLGVNLSKIIDEKIAYNQTRVPKHGKRF